MASNISDEALRSLVIKDSSEGLIAAMSVGQNIFNEKAIKTFSRKQLILYVILLRKCAGQATAVKFLVTSFDPSKVDTLLLESDIDQTSVSQTVQSTLLDNTAVLLALIQSMENNRLKAEEERKIESRRAEEERIAERDLRQKERDRLEEERRKVEEERKIEFRRVEDERRMEIRRFDDERRKADEERILEAKRLDDLRREEVLKEREERELMLEGLKILHAQAADRADMETQRANDKTRKEVRLVNALKITKGLLYKMPENTLDLLLYFKNVEDIYALNNIDSD